MSSIGDGPLIGQSNHSSGGNLATSECRSHEPRGPGHPPLDPKLVIRIGAKQIISLFVPISICMFLVAFLSKNVPFFSTVDVHLIYAPFNTPNADIGTRTWETLLNVAIILGFVVVTTFTLVLLFKFECYKCLTGWFVLTTFIVVFVASFMFFAELLRASMIFVDNITFAILLWNFGVLGLISIHWRSPLILQQAYLIFNSVEVALILIRFLPKWTCWVLLGAISIWDLIAVLCPRGPLRMLVEMAQARDRPLFPAIIYSTAAAYIVATTVHNSTDSTSNAETEISTRNVGGEQSGLPLPNRNDNAVPSNKMQHYRRLETSLKSPLLDSGDEKRNSTQPDGAAKGMARARKHQSYPRVGESDIQHEPQNLTPPLTTGANEPRSHEMGATGERPEAPTEWLRDLQDDVIEREDRGVKLGLGDFVFYSVLIGRASLDGDVLTAVACYVAILVGMCLTIVALAVARRALPALPISIICGIIFYISTAVVITPFVDAISERRLFF
ncbi:hypothetical protein Aperf_G00000027396 [Anoplocephala perfoliata]